MSQKIQLTLLQMQAGQTGTVVHVLGGRGLTRRLEALGIRLGEKVTKIRLRYFKKQKDRDSLLILDSYPH